MQWQWFLALGTWSMVAAIVGAVILLTCLLGYVKAPPDETYIISGIWRRVIIGRAGVRIPFLERLDKLSLKMMSVDVKTNSHVPTAEYINITVDAAVKLKIGTQKHMVAVAAQNFLNQTPAYIIGTVQDVLEGNMREIIGQMRLEEMVTNRKAFAEKVQENAVPDLQRMGLEIVSFNVQSFSHQNGVINDLEIDNISQIKKKAAIAKAEADKEIAKAQAQASKEAMRKYGEAAVLEMYFAALPEIARNVAEPLSKVDKITMYGEGNSAKLVKDIIQSITQISEGFMDGIGIDLKSLLAGFVGGRMGAPAVPVATAVSDESDAPATSAGEEKAKK